MGFEETCDDMLRQEFRPGGTTASAPEAAVTLSAPTLSVSPVAGPVALPVAGPTALPVAGPVAASGDGPRGLARYRSAALVGAGGLACAAVGAVLGGLGGYLPVDTAAAHPTVSAGGSEQALANAVDRTNGYRGSANDAVGTPTLTSLAGSLTQGSSPFRWLTGTGTGFLTAFPLPASLANLPGGGPGPGGSGQGSAGTGGLGCSVTSALALGCILSGVTTAIGDLGSIPGDPGGAGGPLSGAVGNVTGALSAFESLTSLTGLNGLGSLSTLVPDVGSPSGAGAVAAALGAVAGSGAASPSGTGALSMPSLGSIGWGSSPVTPVTRSSGSAATTTTTPSTSTTTTTVVQPSGGTTTTVTVPLPTLPLPSTPPVGVGGISAGVNSGGPSSGLSLSLP